MRLRDQELGRGAAPVPEAFQGVTQARIAQVLSVLGLETRDCVDAVFALLDDVHDSWFSPPPAGAKFRDGASVGQIACHVGILQRSGTKLDREGRDYWIKPLRNIGAIEPIFLDPASRTFLPGHPTPKSPNSAYRLSAEFLAILQATDERRSDLLAAWINADVLRERLAFQASQAQGTRGTVGGSHADLIRACVEHYAPRFLSGFDVLYVDDSDGDRISDEERDNLREAGLELRLGDAMPDVLLYNRELRELWVIEAVISSGEVDHHKVEQLRAFADRHAKAGIGFTTAFPSWRAAVSRARALENIPPATYIWIREDGSKHYRAEDFGADGSKPLTIRSKSS